MEPDKNTPEDAVNQPPQEQEPQAPADALSRTPEDLKEEEAEHAAAAPEAASEQAPEKKVSPLKRLFRKVNVYFLIFILIVVVAGAITIVNYLNSKKAPAAPNIASQELTQEALKQLANTDASVGRTSQTLTIQGNAIIAGQTLIRGALNVAGSLQTGGSIQGPELTISGTSNLGTAQVNSLQVASDTAIQGTTTVRNLNVAGAASFSGPMTASQITVSKIVMSGNAVLEVPNHMSFTGPPVSRTVTSANSATLGSGGSVSISGSDTTGTINISTGGGPSAGCFVRVNFQQSFTGQPHVIVSPVGAAAGQLQYYVDRNTSGFTLCTNNAPAANQSFAFDYFATD
jgi:hypothetical protein